MINKESSYHSIMGYMRSAKSIKEWNARRTQVKATCKLANKAFVSRFIDSGKVFSFHDKENTTNTLIKSTKFAKC
jgi:hypothetical protein